MEYNTNNNLTYEARAHLERWINREFKRVNHTITIWADDLINIDDLPQAINDCPLYCPCCNESFDKIECDEQDLEYDGECPNSGCDVLLEYDEDQRATWPPMWDTVWFLPNWVSVQHADEAGFTVYESIHGTVIGVDGAGYGFYEQHWAPLYRAAMDQSLPNDKIDCDCKGKDSNCSNCGGKGYTIHKTREQKRELQHKAAMDLVLELSNGHYMANNGLKHRAQDVLDMTE